MSGDWKERAKAQFREARTRETLVAIPVPEWGTTVWYWPAMTLGERREIFLLAKSDGDNTILDLEAIAVTMIVRARDADGKRLFAKAERFELLNDYDPGVLARIVGAMQTAETDPETAQKN